MHGTPNRGIRSPVLDESCQPGRSNDGGNMDTMPRVKNRGSPGIPHTSRTSGKRGARASGKQGPSPSSTKAEDHRQSLGICDSYTNRDSTASGSVNTAARSRRDDVAAGLNRAIKQRRGRGPTLRHLRRAEISCTSTSTERTTGPPTDTVGTTGSAGRRP